MLNDKSLADIENPRLLGLKEKTLRFNFRIIYVPGRKHCGPDYMSRHGLSKSEGMTGTKEVRISCIMGMLRAQEDCGNTDLDTYIDIDHGLVRSITASLNMIVGLRAVTFERVKKA